MDLFDTIHHQTHIVDSLRDENNCMNCVYSVMYMLIGVNLVNEVKIIILIHLKILSWMC